MKNLVYNFCIKMKKLKVVQFEGLAPSVFCGLYFADQGAEVVLIARQQSTPFSMPIDLNIMNRNKRCITINLKKKEQYNKLLTLIREADIVIDPYRPGVLEKLKLGPQNLYQLNKRIILLRVSGYGQTGPSALRPGHDINYLSASGILSLVNKEGQYQFPSNYMADFVSASLGITGTLAALIERQKTGEGKVVDCSLTNGLTYFAQKIIQKPLAEKQYKVTSFQNNNNTFVCTSRKAINYEQIQLLLMIGDKDYFRSQNGQLQISRVKEIQGFDTTKLINPFSSIKLPGAIKKKGQDNQLFQSLFKPKL